MRGRALGVLSIVQAHAGVGQTRSMASASSTSVGLRGAAMLNGGRTPPCGRWVPQGREGLLSTSPPRRCYASGVPPHHDSDARYGSI